MTPRRRHGRGGPRRGFRCFHNGYETMPTPRRAVLTSFGVVTADNFAMFVNLILVAVGILNVIFSSQTVYRDGLPAGEYYAVMLFAIVGMILMVQSTDLLLVFLALETMSPGHPLAGEGQRGPG